MSQFNGNSAWKMGWDMKNDEKWMGRYMVLWKEIKAQLDVVLETAVKIDAYINPRLIT